MKPRYDDILILSQGHQPFWWDENGVPRFAQFEPAMTARPYARQVALAQCCCPRCRRAVDLALSSEDVKPDLQALMTAHTVGQLYGLLPHYDHCGQPYQPELMGVRSVWRRVDMLVWKQVWPPKIGA